MVEMWDGSFCAQDTRIEDALHDGQGSRAFQLMHSLLDDVWERIANALCPGGILAINIGDATRRLDGEFQLYPNHARVIEGISKTGLTQLPGIIWRKPTNSTTKFMGSGTIPTNAYATLEHEHILLFRNGSPREFPPKDTDRYASAFFWEERNSWFSDVWEIIGSRQSMMDTVASRDRSGAFPLEIPLRLILMYSIRGDMVLDPFAGTGTTTKAAMMTARSSIGIERDNKLACSIPCTLGDIESQSFTYAQDRLDAHNEFVAGRDSTPSYSATNYDTHVVTKSEQDIWLPVASDFSIEVNQKCNQSCEAGVEKYNRTKSLPSDCILQASVTHERLYSCTGDQ